MPCSMALRLVSLASMRTSWLKPVKMPQRPALSTMLWEMTTPVLVTERMPAREMEPAELSMRKPSILT